MQDFEHIRLWRRLAAASYDLLIVIAVLMLVTGVVILARGGTAFDPASTWFRLLLLTAWWAYFARSWTHGGQTVGMRAWGIELVDTHGGSAGLGAATLRFLVAWLSALALGLGFLLSVVDRERRTWHDRLSGTRLVRKPGSAEPQHGNHRHEQ
jgi:uncharacterized RDD family membrane protein YckC